MCKCNYTLIEDCLSILFVQIYATACSFPQPSSYLNSPVTLACGITILFDYIHRFRFLYIHHFNCLKIHHFHCLKIHLFVFPWIHCLCQFITLLLIHRMLCLEIRYLISSFAAYCLKIQHNICLQIQHSLCLKTCQFR